ncbi:RNA-directed DNA polymerase, eukaryota, reverse transcriptase zinc-binding domain protein [Tanacetum coccineum]
MGDFNAALSLEDISIGSSKIDISIRKFKTCVNDIEVMDVNKSGLLFTWNQQPKGVNGILKKLDRIMANLEFNNAFVGDHAIFKPYRISDHSSLVLKIPTLAYSKPKPFKFFNFLTLNDQFREVVSGVWNQHISGFFMFRLVKKLKILKKPLRKLMYEKGNLHANVIRLRGELDSVQEMLDKDPYNPSLRETEARCVVEFNEAAIMEERFLKQKAKIQWLKEGDSNSAYFHKSVKSRTSRSRIDAVTNTEGIVCENEMVVDAFVSHYEAFLGQADVTNGFNTNILFKTCLGEQVALDMV